MIVEGVVEHLPASLLGALVSNLMLGLIDFLIEAVFARGGVAGDVADVGLQGAGAAATMGKVMHLHHRALARIVGEAGVLGGAPAKRARSAYTRLQLA